jgi:glutamate racemase
MNNAMNNAMSPARKPAPPNVAFFDSGQGGFTVWEAIRKRLPALNTIYLGDNARYPYGNKGAQTVTRYASEAAYFLSTQNTGLIVVACGTASSVAVETLQRVFRIPVVGIVEGFCEEAAALAGADGVVAVLGTRYTVASGRFERELRARGTARVWARACPLFVPLVEEALVPGPLADSACELYLSDIPADVKVVMLACTHFPRLERTIARYLGERFGRPVVARKIDGDVIIHAGLPENASSPLFLLESAPSIGRAVDAFLSARSPDEDNAYRQGDTRVYCTDAPARFAEVAKVFTHLPVEEIQEVTLGM